MTIQLQVIKQRRALRKHQKKTQSDQEENKESIPAAFEQQERKKEMISQYPQRKLAYLESS